MTSPIQPSRSVAPSLPRSPMAPPAPRESESLPQDAVTLQGAPVATPAPQTQIQGEVQTEPAAVTPNNTPPTVLTEVQAPALPEDLQKAVRILENAPVYRQQVGAEYVGQVVGQVPREFPPWLQALQPVVAGQAGNEPKMGSDPYHLLGMQLKTLALAAVMAETQAQMAQVRGEAPDRKQLLGQELDFQFRTQAYCQVASPELLDQIAARPAPPEAQFSGRWFCEQLQGALGRPPQVQSSALQRVLTGNPELLTGVDQQLPGTANNWTQVIKTTSGYLEHMNCVMVAENDAAGKVMEFTQR